MKSALVILFNDFEEIEAVNTIDVLRRGGIDVTIASLNNGKEVIGFHQIALLADVVGIPKNIFDILVIPGGRGILNLRHNKIIEDCIKRHYESSRLIAAICAAPILLHDLGILEKHRYTAHFSMTDELSEARTHELVVTDGNIITGCGPAAAINFGLAILKYTNTVESVREITHVMMCDLWDV